ncbi:hypothetical protein [Sphingomonas yabuuchiae]|uniref:Uncharacterized protein n=2 Tax=Sphingomonas yabuuchiae TaxID=172044 RepID=A0ABR6K6T9_9SPHN|nr:hypothetical protein [Sphingomonas yabuuchiae]
MADLAGRIMLTHRLVPEHLMAVIDLTHEQAVALIAEGRLSVQLDCEQQQRLRLFVNILHRLEWRLNHDSDAIRHALDLPLAVLDNKAPAQLFCGSIDDLRAVRLSIDSVEAPKVKWYRTGH